MVFLKSSAYKSTKLSSKFSNFLYALFCTSDSSNFSCCFLSILSVSINALTLISRPGHAEATNAALPYAPCTSPLHSGSPIRAKQCFLSSGTDRLITPSSSSYHILHPKNWNSFLSTVIFDAEINTFNPSKALITTFHALIADSLLRAAMMMSSIKTKQSVYLGIKCLTGARAL